MTGQQPPNPRGDGDMPQDPFAFIDDTLSFPEGTIPTVTVETLNVFVKQLSVDPDLILFHSNEIIEKQPHLFAALSQLAVVMGLDSDGVNSAMTIVAASYLLIKRQLEIEQTTGLE